MLLANEYSASDQPVPALTVIFANSDLIHARTNHPPQITLALFISFPDPTLC